MNSTHMEGQRTPEKIGNEVAFDWLCDFLRNCPEGKLVWQGVGGVDEASIVPGKAAEIAVNGSTRVIYKKSSVPRPGSIIVESASPSPTIRPLRGNDMYQLIKRIYTSARRVRDIAQNGPDLDESPAPEVFGNQNQKLVESVLKAIETRFREETPPQKETNSIGSIDTAHFVGDIRRWVNGKAEL